MPEGLETEEAIYGWLDEIEARYGSTVDLEPMPTEDHAVIDPIAELRMMRPDAPIVVIQAQPPES